MTAKASFDRSFVVFDEHLPLADRQSDVLIVIEDFVQKWGYSLRNLIGAQISHVGLSGKGGMTRDLILEISGEDFFEVILRGQGNEAYYGGWLAGTVPVTIAPEIVNGRPILLTSGQQGVLIRHTYDPVLGYQPDGDATELSVQVMQRLAMAD